MLTPQTLYQQKWEWKRTENKEKYLKDGAALKTALYLTLWRMQPDTMPFGTHWESPWPNTNLYLMSTVQACRSYVEEIPKGPTSVSSGVTGKQLEG